MHLFKTASGPGGGFYPASAEVHALKNQTGAAISVGSLVQIDLSFANTTDSTSGIPGADGSVWLNAETPLAATPATGMSLYVIARTAAAATAGAEFDGFYWGVENGLVTAAGAVALGDELVPATSRALDAGGSIGEIVIGHAMEAATPGTPGSMRVFLNGMAGMFGQLHA